MAPRSGLAGLLASVSTWRVSASICVFRDVDFHVQRGADAAAKRLALIAFEKKILIQRGNAGEPGIAQRAAIDEVKMGVDDGRKGHLANPGEWDARRHDNPKRRASPKRSSRAASRLDFDGAIARERTMC